MGSDKQMKVLMMVGFVLFLTITIQVIPSSAQVECWERIQLCLEGTASQAEFEQQCCPLLLQEITNERECFCSIKPVFLQNATIAGAVSGLVSVCSTTSFLNFCPGDVSSPVETPPSLPPGGSTPTTQSLPLLAGETPSPSQALPPMMPSLGLMKTLNEGVRFASEGNNAGEAPTQA
ncbi:uncharacterized protein [Spinacia oleracea]|uniref:Uncharacterized protein isoform X2 n=1 Tax=Spinacia oleracea TaxID=3562 RepID=A0A9R0K2C2_SPIOL|nr:uncharacterized protein LOC110795257 isoform X2 [Spinacia oleracea]